MCRVCALALHPFRDVPFGCVRAGALNDVGADELEFLAWLVDSYDAGVEDGWVLEEDGFDVAGGDVVWGF